MPALHPALMAIFLGLFTLMAVITLVSQVRQRKPFPSVLLLIATVVFGMSTWITATQ